MHSSRATAVTDGQVPATALLRVFAPLGAKAAGSVTAAVPEQQLLKGMGLLLPRGILFRDVDAMRLHLLLEGLLVVAVATTEEMAARAQCLLLYAVPMEEVSAAGCHQNTQGGVHHLLGTDCTQVVPTI